VLESGDLQAEQPADKDVTGFMWVSLFDVAFSHSPVKRVSHAVIVSLPVRWINVRIVDEFPGNQGGAGSIVWGHPRR
jgi:hypothetical protein